MKPKKALEELETLFHEKWAPADVIMFQSRHKLQLMAQAPDVFKELSQISASVSQIDASSFERAYRAQFTKAMKTETTIAKNVKVLDQTLIQLKEHATKEELQEYKQLIEAYRTKNTTLTKPVNRLRKLADKYDVEALRNQSYLEK